MRRAAVLLGALLALTAAAPARAYWRVSGSGSGTAPVDVLSGGNQPTVSANGRTVTVSFAQTAFGSGWLGTFGGGGYALSRYPGGPGAAVTPSAPCAAVVSGSATTLSCAEPNVPFGSWRYSVSPRLGAQWTGSESPLSAPVQVVPDAPVGVTARPAAGGRIDIAWSAVADASGYDIFRRTGTGSYDYAAPLNGDTPLTATTFADTATSTGTTYRYVVRAVAAATPSGTVTSADSAEVSAPADAAAPTGVVLTDPGTPLRGTVGLSATATDAGTGVATVRFQRAPAGTSTWTDVCTASAPPFTCAFATTAAGDGLYDLRAIATDAAGNATSSATVASRRVDNTAPAATLADPGAYLRGTVTLTSTASDGGSGLASVEVQRAPTGTTAWTDICSTPTASPCSFATPGVADGVYDLRVLATDAAGNATPVVVTGRTVDNTKPVGTDVQATNNVGGTAGRPEAGDWLTFTYSEPLAPASILAGWTGAATTVTVDISARNPGVLQVYDAGNSAAIPVGSVALGERYATKALTFTGSSMVMSGATITVTLGTPTVGTARTGTVAGSLVWTTVATPMDLAGNVLTASTVTESGTADLEF